MPGFIGTQNKDFYLGDKKLGAVYLGDILKWSAGPPPALPPGRARKRGSAIRFGVNESQPRSLAWDGTNLYMIGLDNDVLYTLDRTTGVATRVGNATRFGVNENLPLSIEWDGTNLYMIGSTNDVLYTLDRTTGVATRVGSATNFGVSGLRASGIGWDGTTMFLSGWVSINSRIRYRLYSLDRTTGVATLITDSSHNLGAAGDLAWDGINLYMTGSDDLFYVNRNTGIAYDAAIAGPLHDDFGVDETRAHGLAWDGTTLWMVGDSNSVLYEVGRLPVLAPGEARQIGRANAFGVNENSPFGLTWDGINLYMIGRDNDALFTVNRDTGVATRVGNATRFGRNLQNIWGFAWNGSNLYMIDGSGTNVSLYTLDRITGAATRITGRRGFGVNESNGPMAWDGTQMYLGGTNTRALYTLDLTTMRATKVGRGFGNNVIPTDMAWDGTNLYLVDDTNDALFTVDRTTGVATRVGSASAFGVNELRPFGLAWDGKQMYMTGLDFKSLYKLQILPPTGVRSLIFGTRLWTARPTRTAINLVEHKGQVYSLDLGNNYLQTVDMSNGALKRVGTADNFGASSRRVGRGLASDGTNLYMLELLTDALYTLNTTTGVATRVGTATNFGISLTTQQLLCWHNDTLYMTTTQFQSQGVGSALYTLNTTTGVATRVGSATNWGLGATDVLMQGLGSRGGNLYGITETNLYVINTTDGTATEVPNAKSIFSNIGIVRGSSLVVYNDAFYAHDRRLGQLFSIT